VALGWFGGARSHLGRTSFAHESDLWEVTRFNLHRHVQGGELTVAARRTEEVLIMEHDELRVFANMDVCKPT
jgi:hypothetical protein